MCIENINVKFATSESEVAKKRIELAKKVMGIFPRRDDLIRALVLEEDDEFFDSTFIGSYLHEMSTYEYFTHEERVKLFKEGKEGKILEAAKEATACLEAFEKWCEIESIGNNKEEVEKEKKQEY